MKGFGWVNHSNGLLPKMATLRTEFPCPLAKLKIVINLMKSSQSPNVKRLTRTFQGRELLGQEVYHEIVEKEMFKVEYPGNTQVERVPYVYITGYVKSRECPMLMQS